MVKMVSYMRKTRYTKGGTDSLDTKPPTKPGHGEQQRSKMWRRLLTTKYDVKQPTKTVDRAN
jgi:hypothetical protein